MPVGGRGERDAEDLTARARIRDAALRQFAERGVEGATIRGIAEAAGVSPGLVQHHFGSKEALREACDAYAFDTLWRTKMEALEGGMASPDFLSVAVRTAVPIQRYIARAMADGSPGAAKFFDDVVGLSKKIFESDLPGVSPPRTKDLHAYAATMVAMHTGLIVMHEHLSRAMGVEILSPEGYPRLSLALLDIYSDELLSPDMVAQARAALERMLAEGDDG